MSEKTTDARSQNPFLKMAETQLSQMNAMLDEVAKMQAAGIEQAKTALDESARLSKETLVYWSALAGESRRMTLDACKRSMAMFNMGQG